MCNVWAECTVGWTLWALHSLTCPLPRSKLVFGKIPWGAPVKRKQFTSRYSKAIDCPCLIKGPAESVQRQQILTNNGHVVVICGFWLARFFSNLCHFRIPKNPRECRMRLFFTLACFCCLSTMTPVGAKIVQRGGEKKTLKKTTIEPAFPSGGLVPSCPLERYNLVGMQPGTYYYARVWPLGDGAASLRLQPSWCFDDLRKIGK